MFVLIAYGLWIVLVSIAMVVNPTRFVEAGIRYCKSRFMHPIEILITVGPGLAFIFLSDQTRFPRALQVFGYVLLVVGVGLMLTPPSIHRRFGIWSLQKFGKTFRPAGVFSLAFGTLLIYAVL